jgi:uncharacterized protein
MAGRTSDHVPCHVRDGGTTEVEPLVIALALVVMVVGLVGVVVPVLPGLLLVWLAGAGTMLYLETDTAGWTVAILLTLLFALGSGATIWLPARQGRRGGVPLRSLLVALLGAVVGFVVLPVVGFLVGAFAGLLVGEQQRLGGDWTAARASVGQVLRAYGVGVVVELVVGVLMIATWLVALVVRS